MKAKEFIIVEAKVAQKPKSRNPVAKNLGVTASGAGAHRDKKRDAKMGVEKHKKDPVTSESVAVIPSTFPDNFKEGKTHVSPSGVETNMDPSDDDYEINYGKNGSVAKFRKKQGLDVETGKKVNEVDMSSPEFQRLLKSVGEKAKQGPKKTVYDPKTGKYKVVPVNPQGNKNG